MKVKKRINWSVLFLLCAVVTLGLLFSCTQDDGTTTQNEDPEVDNDFLMVSMAATVYPNPARSENLNISISSGDNHTPIILEIVDLTGQVFYRSTIDSALRFDTKIVPDRKMRPGLYFMLIKQGNNTFQQKVVID